MCGVSGIVIAVEVTQHLFEGSDELPVVVLAPSGPLFEKAVCNMEEVQARGCQVIVISDADRLADAIEGSLATIQMPKTHPLITPVVYTVASQLLAYHVAVLKGTYVDRRGASLNPLRSNNPNSTLEIRRATFHAVLV